ncbi:Heparan sulfate 2-O-sulfotransferase hst-2 [Holothuria leucospilota]|uniref:Heparan sulfate 2-O-sulfotransferase hst-2 n=1 Tax=Holothuria leucospilota TaxID=206669 RepID=A0A9Q1C3N6_HOLLE|nr:Heparan sulfate 2-O-sulfotransferase hst-2 [Holothuria leucospilota]
MNLSNQEIFLASLLFIISSFFILIPPCDYLGFSQERKTGGKLMFLTDTKNALQRAAAYQNNSQVVSEQSPITELSTSEPRDVCTTKALRGTNYTIIYNAMPKTGSRTLSTISLQLFKKRFKSNTRFHTIAITPKISELRRNSTKLLEYYRQTSQKTAFIRGHNAFVHPADRSYICINTIREPIPWMTSQYYFRTNGDSRGREHSKNKTTSDLTFDECFSRGLLSCKPQIGNYLAYFCGDDPICNTPGALKRSKANVDKFLFVGLNEEFKDTIRILELLIPDIFKGLTKDYEKKFSELKRSFTTISKKKLSEKTEETLRRDPNVRVMYEFYEFVKDRFHRLKKCLLQD